MKSEDAEHGNAGWINGGHRETVWRMCVLMSLSAFVCAFILFAALPAYAYGTGLKESTDHHTLEIYGNANEDDIIDVRDVTYIKLVIFGKKPETDLCDANYDGRVSMLDVVQTKLIIVGKEGELTVVDHINRIVTIHKPVDRIVSVFPGATRLILGLGAADKLVGLGTWDHEYVVNDYQRVGLHAPNWEKVVGDLRELSEVGSGYTPDVELILSLKPDIVLTYEYRPEYKALQDAGIPVIGVPTSTELIKEGFYGLKFLGYVLDKEERAEEIIGYFDEIVSDVTEITETIPEEEKPRVYFFWGSHLTKASIRYDTIELAGGILVSKDCAPPTFGGSVTDIEKEQIIDWNPDIILVSTNIGRLDPKVEDILSDPDLQTVTAVKEKKVYYTLGAYYLVGIDPPRLITELIIQAKLFHPDKFEDLDLEKDANELFERFYGVDGLWTEFIEIYKEKYGFDPWSNLESVK